MQWNELPLDKTRGVVIEHRLYFRKYMQASYNVQTIKAGNEYTITGEKNATTVMFIITLNLESFNFL